MRRVWLPVRSQGVRAITAVVVLGLLGAVALPEPAAVAVTTQAPAEATPSPGPTEPAATPSPEATMEPEPATDAGTPSPEVTPSPEARVDDESADGGRAAEAEEGAAPPAAVAASLPAAGRLSGTDRIATSVAAARAVYPDAAPAVLITSAFAPVDAVVAAARASELGAPLLYVRPTAVPDEVVDEIRRLSPSAIVVVGGPVVVSDSVLATLRTIVSDVRRFGGADRYDTSRAALVGAGRTTPTVYVAGGSAMVDPPLASVAAAATGAGAVLIDGSRAIDDATVAALRAVSAVSVRIVGGPNTVGSAWEATARDAGFDVTRLVAPDRYRQAVLMAGERGEPAARAIVANSTAEPDVAVAAAVAAGTRQPLFYSTLRCMTDPVAEYLAAQALAVTAVGGPLVVDGPVLQNRPCTEVRAERIAALNAAIRTAAQTYAGSFTVTVHEIGGLGEITHVGGGERREAASMMKIFASWAALKRIEQGRASLTTRLSSGLTVGVCIQLMIHISDNYCHDDIVHWIGIAELNRMISSAGFANTYYGNAQPGSSVLYAGNRSSTNDMAWMMQRLEQHSVLGARYADILLGHMRSQIGRGRIASGIPPGVAQASKPGALWVASGLLQADTAIVYGPASTYALSIIGYDAPPQAALRAISRAVYEHFHGPFGAAATYPVEQMVTTRQVGLRSGPAGAVVVVVPAGTPVQALDARRDWYLVRYGGRDLWVHYTDLRNR